MHSIHNSFLLFAHIILCICTGAERATTLTTLMLTNSQIIKSTESPSIQPSATTSPWIQPSNSPSSVPDVHRHSYYLVAIVGVAVGVLAATVLAIVIGLIRCKRYRAHTVHRQASASGMLLACINSILSLLLHAPMIIRQPIACKAGRS